MFKRLLTIVFSLFLLFQTASLAEEANEDQQENMIEEVKQENQAEKVQEKESQEEISEAMREAQAAEEAELREAGVGEEPVPE